MKRSLTHFLAVYMGFKQSVFILTTGQRILFLECVSRLVKLCERVIIRVSEFPSSY